MKSSPRKAAPKAVPKRTPDPPTVGRSLAIFPYQIGDGTTQSMLSGFINCRVGCRMGLEGWHQPRTKDAINYGSLYHALLEHFFRGVMNGKLTRKDAEAFFVEHTEAWLAKQRQESNSSNAIQSSEICVAQAYATWEPYLDAWPDDFEPGRWVELEGVFAVDFRGYTLRGRKDGLQRCGDKRKYYRLMENKTKSQIDEGSIDLRLTFDFQNLFYLTVQNIELRERGENETARIVCYNIIRRPGQRFNPEKESLDDYSARVRAAIEKDPGHFFTRSEVTYTAKDFERFEKELELKLHLFERWLLGKEETFKNEMACVSKWNCSYLQACSAGGDMTGYVQTGRLLTELEE
ncbi:MAG TPA: PD-(D/E)XK nuclease family protein [Planctomycetota bacterium]|nr:PD-(D/E)XK nuclease family protein [Planctomycetota bacterium]